MGVSFTEWVNVVAIVVGVAAVAVIVVVNTLVWAGSVVDVWADVVRGGARSDVAVTHVLDTEAIGWEFPVSVSWLDVGVDMFVDASLSSGVAVADIGVGVLIDVNKNVLTGVVPAL